MLICWTKVVLAENALIMASRWMICSEAFHLHWKCLGSALHLFGGVILGWYDIDESYQTKLIVLTLFCLSLRIKYKQPVNNKENLNDRK